MLGQRADRLKLACPSWRSEPAAIGVEIAFATLAAIGDDALQ
jgi:hypothetical protein